MTPALAARFAAMALGHVRREFPNAPGHRLTGPDARTPSELHPVFYGSYDWHSCVHGYWMLAHLARRYPRSAEAAAIRALFDEQLTAPKVAIECDYFAAPAARGFERPYGWAWLLKLAAELTLHEERWSNALAPLAALIAQLLRDFLPIATYPVRVGTHANTAFALRMAADYAAATHDAALASLLAQTARRWYAADENCPAWGEPSGNDFLSSALIEAECMRRLLPADEFLDWFDRFLPSLSNGEPATLLRPATVSDRSDGQIAHLDGLNLSRAWCWRSIASALAPDDPRRAIALRSADEHLAAALPHLASDYMGEHWLATYAVLAMTSASAHVVV